MKMNMGRILYVNVESVAFVDVFETKSPYCQSIGDRQVVIDAECFMAGWKGTRFSEPPELRTVAESIFQAVETESPEDINIYC